LVFIYLQEQFSEAILNFINIQKVDYFAYFGIPMEFLFFFWLYAAKSLQNLKLFYFFILIYFLSFFPIENYFEKIKIVYSFNYCVGAFLLMILVFLEYHKQIVNDNILEFKQNKMFYINTGVLLFYIGNLPFFGLYKILINEPTIWNNYYIYFLVSNCIMYLLFAASFIWGKPKS
jgi:hypothetical protein